MSEENGIKKTKPSSSPCRLPPPSSEQSAIINEILNGKCVVVKACAGSGKTTTMLHIANSLPKHKKVIIITYNRSLSDECKERIKHCNLQSSVWCYTIHGIMTRVSGQICNDDSKLIQIVRKWDKDGLDCSFNLDYDLVMLDEAQDLRPSFYSALCHILSKNKPFVQMAIVGDPKQMLYNFATYGSDRASTIFIENPQQHFGQFTKSRKWVERELSVSYRLTPNIAHFVNAVWGTKIKGGNTQSENIPVEYICRYPFPSKTPPGLADFTRLKTDILSDLIDSYGPENVMLLAQSVKNDKCPIRLHVNELMNKKDSSGRSKYNFHIKESIRGFEEGDFKNKVRVWTFCGSKGCEADCVVVFGYDIMPGNRIHSLNQIGVALSRARKKLVVIHGKTYVKEKKDFSVNQYYPMMGDALGSAIYTVEGVDGSPKQIEIASMEAKLSESRRKEVIETRSKSMMQTLELLVQRNIVSVEKQGKEELPIPTNTSRILDNQLAVYSATEFGYFAASVEEKFIQAYAKWTQESGIIDRIDYKSDVKFNNTSENISALYGEAVVYMLQFERNGFCPNIETITSDAMLVFKDNYNYDMSTVRKMMSEKKCEPLSQGSEALFCLLFRLAPSKKIEGKSLIKALNSNIKITKKRNDGNRTIFFPVKAVSSSVSGEQMNSYLPDIKRVYYSKEKTPSEWVYLANAVMAFGLYHDKWYQVGKDHATYSKWVESEKILIAKSRLLDLMELVPVPKYGPLENNDEGDIDGGFERMILYEFDEIDQLSHPAQSRNVIGVCGICDWIGIGLRSKSGIDVDILEIKFCSELGNAHRIQLLTYCALFCMEKERDCTGLLFNCRTLESEVCMMEVTKAKDFLLDISLFKFDGTQRKKTETQSGNEIKESIAIKKENHENEYDLDPKSSQSFKKRQVDNVCDAAYSAPKRNQRESLKETYMTSHERGQDDSIIDLTHSDEEL